MESIILAGGFGTRLRSTISDVPKPMADINGMPFLNYILEYLFKNNITDIVLSIGYKKEIIEDYFQSKYKTINIKYSREEEPLGTGGAIKKSLALCRDENVLVLNGDTFFKLNLKNLIDQHSNTNSDITMSLKEMHNFDRYGKVVLQNNRIIKFEEKKFCKYGVINGGVYIVKKNIFLNLEDKFSFEEDFLKKKLSQFNIYGYLDDGYFIDIGVPKDYRKAVLDFKDKLII